MNAFRWLGSLLVNGVGKKSDREPPLDIRKVEAALGYHFKDPFLLYRSLKHRSYSQARDGNIYLSNERLEFLGDSVLNLVVAHSLFTRNPNFQEGDLTKLKSTLVSKTSTAIAGKKVGIDRFILLSSSEEDAGGRERTSIIADTFEAIIGAIYLDGGLDPAAEFIRRTILNEESVLAGEEQKNYKSILLEMAQSKKLGHPVYRTISEEGPDHDKLFTVEAFIMGDSIGVGKGKSKKIAQQMAAREGLTRLNRMQSVKP